MPWSRRRFLASASAFAVAACSSADDGSTGATARTDSTARATATTAPPSGVITPSVTTAEPTTAEPTTAEPTTDLTPGGPAAFVDHGPTSRNLVALTFHTDGDLSMAHQIFDILEESSVVATCFLVGSWLEANPLIAERINGGGHEPANHTYSHPTLGDLGADAIATEIVRCRDVLESVLGTGGRYFRPSGTADGTSVPSDAVLDEAGRAGYPTVVGFDVDPFDYQDPGADAVTSATLGGIGPGAIVSLHFGYQSTIDALPGIIKGLASRGLVPVPLSQLLM